MKSVIIKVMTGFFLFAAGAAVAVPVCRMYDKSRAAEEAAVVSSGSEDPVDNRNGVVIEGELQLRVRDGSLEWFDGVRWNDAGSVNELMAADPIGQPSEEWQALSVQLAEARAGEYAAEREALSREGGSLSVDEVTASSSQNAARPAESVTTKPTTPATTKPTTPAGPAQNNDGNDGSNDNDSGNDDDSSNDNDSSNDHNEPPAPEPEPEPEPEPAPDDTGDGENIEWSGDYE